MKCYHAVSCEYLSFKDNMYSYNEMNLDNISNSIVFNIARHYVLCKPVALQNVIWILSL